MILYAPSTGELGGRGLRKHRASSTVVGIPPCSVCASSQLHPVSCSPCRIERSLYPTTIGITMRILKRHAFTLTAITFSLLVLVATTDARASMRSGFYPTTATWYGPGFYGNNFACEGRDKWTPSSYQKNVRGVAHMWLSCGSKVTLRYRKRSVRVRVIDTGAFGYNNFDLTARTAMDLCACSAPHTLRLYWKRGWVGIRRAL